MAIRVHLTRSNDVDVENTGINSEADMHWLSCTSNYSFLLIDLKKSPYDKIQRRRRRHVARAKQNIKIEHRELLREYLDKCGNDF